MSSDAGVNVETCQQPDLVANPSELTENILKAIEDEILLLEGEKREYQSVLEELKRCQAEQLHEIRKLDLEMQNKSANARYYF